MVLEATFIIADNSEWMRNGDYTPSRIESQNDAVNLIFRSKTQSNPENTVGLMTMAGKSPEVHVTLTADTGKILSALHTMKLGGKANFTTGIQIAQLALKHRQNKNQRQRVIVFVGSPLDVNEKNLVKIGKKLKKNNVAVDVINFGENDENITKLEAFINTVNSGDNSHLVTIPPGPHILSDMLLSSPIIAGEGGAPGGFSDGSGGGYEFGVDANLDPELALALRMSLEEERARQQAGSGSDPNAMAVDTPGKAAASNDEEDMLAKALVMSMTTSGNDDDVAMDGSDDPEVARAIAMSMKDSKPAGNNPSIAMADILGSLPGVDRNDPRLQNLAANSTSPTKKSDSKEKKREN